MRHILTLCLAILTVLLAFVDPALAGFCAFGTVATHMFGDGNLKVTKALPAGASAVTTDGIDTGEGTTGTQITPMEFLLEVPALLTGVLGDAATMKYDVVTSASSDMSGPVTIAKEILVQTGADGAGAAASSARFKIPTNALRYVGVKCTKSSAGSAAASSMTLSLKF